MKLSNIFNLTNLKSTLSVIGSVSTVATPIVGVFSPPAQVLLSRISGLVHAAEIAIPVGPTSNEEKLNAVLHEVVAGLNFSYATKGKVMSDDRQRQAVAAISGLKDTLNFIQGVTNDLGDTAAETAQVATSLFKAASNMQTNTQAGSPEAALASYKYSGIPTG